jgi:hypothetical protein
MYRGQRDMIFIVTWVFPTMLLCGATAGLGMWVSGGWEAFLYAALFNLYVFVGYLTVLPAARHYIRYPEAMNGTEGWRLALAALIWPYTFIKYCIRTLIFP